MKKLFVLFIMVVCITMNVFSQEIREIDLRSKENTHQRSIRLYPIAYQENTIISIKLPSTAIYAIVTITNKVTGEQVYSMVLTNTSTIRIDLSADDKGEYIVALTFNDKDYSGEFTI